MDNHKMSTTTYSRRSALLTSPQLHLMQYSIFSIGEISKYYKNTIASNDKRGKEAFPSPEPNKHLQRAATTLTDLAERRLIDFERSPKNKFRFEMRIELVESDLCLYFAIVLNIAYRVTQEATSGV